MSTVGVVATSRCRSGTGRHRGSSSSGSEATTTPSVRRAHRQGVAQARWPRSPAVGEQQVQPGAGAVAATRRRCRRRRRRVLPGPKAVAHERPHQRRVGRRVEREQVGHRQPAGEPRHAVRPRRHHGWPVADFLFGGRRPICCTGATPKSWPLGLAISRSAPLLSAGTWLDGQHLTISFAGDGTPISGVESDLSGVFSSLGSDVAKLEMLRAFQTWTAWANLNVGLVADTNLSFGTPGAIQGDPRFGDIRVGARSLAGDVITITAPFSLLTPNSGDIIVNNTKSFVVGGGGDSYDLFTVFMQESGHAYGMGNSVDPTSVMYEYYGVVLRRLVVRGHRQHSPRSTARGQAMHTKEHSATRRWQRRRLLQAPSKPT